MHILSYCFALFLAIVSVVVYGVDLWVNYEAFNKNNNNVRQIRNNYVTQIQPPYWVLTTWLIIYALLAVWYVYIFLLFLRQLFSRNKMPLFPGLFWLVLIVIHVLNGLWIYLYVNDDMLASGIILAALALMLYFINMIAFRICWFDVTYDKPMDDDNDVENNNDDIIELSRFEVGLLRFATLNGLPLYAIWCTLAAVFQWTMLFQYYTFHWSASVSSIVALSILSIILLLYGFMEIISLRKYFVYTWLPGIALIVTFGSIIARFNSIGGPNRPGLTFVFALLIVGIVVFLVKLSTLCCCPPKYDNLRFSRVARV